MKKKLIIIIISIILVIGILVLILINNIYKDKTDIAKDIEVINDNYQGMVKEIENYNSTRLNVASIINDLYYDTISSKYEENKKLLDNYTLIIDNISDYVKVLDSKCNIIYGDSNVNNKCKNYKYNYELIVNVYMNDINNYNKKLNSYNDNYDEKLEEYKTKYNYIDYNNDKKYEEVETNE